MSSTYKDNLPPIPKRMLRLPVLRGYPVPWFVAKVEGEYDFRIADATKMIPAVQNRLCWLCGQKMGQFLAFVIGPMCTINRVSSEPPCHKDCAEFAVQACPFLLGQAIERREAKLPEGVKEPPGTFLKANPGISVIWIAKSYHPRDVDGGWLFHMGHPEYVFWYKDGRQATTEECLSAIGKGIPQLIELAQGEGIRSVVGMAEAAEKAIALIPKDKQ